MNNLYTGTCSNIEKRYSKTQDIYWGQGCTRHTDRRRCSRESTVGGRTNTYRVSSFKSDFLMLRTPCASISRTQIWKNKNQSRHNLQRDTRSCRSGQAYNQMSTKREYREVYVFWGTNQVPCNTRAKSRSMQIYLTRQWNMRVCKFAYEQGESTKRVGTITSSWGNKRVYIHVYTFIGKVTWTGDWVDRVGEVTRTRGVNQYRVCICMQVQEMYTRQQGRWLSTTEINKTRPTPCAIITLPLSMTCRTACLLVP